MAVALQCNLLLESMAIWMQVCITFQSSFFFSLLHTQSWPKRFPHIVYLKMKTRLLYNNSNFDFVYCNWQKKMMVYFFLKRAQVLLQILRLDG